MWAWKNSVIAGIMTGLTSGIMTCSAWIGSNLHIAAVATVGSALLEYSKQLSLQREEDKNQEHGSRIDRTFKIYVEQFNKETSDIAPAARDIDKMLETHSKEISKALSHKENPRIYGEYIEKISLPHKENILKLADFYEEVEECVESGLCDETTARQLFQDKGTAFFVAFEPFLEDLEKNRKDYSGINLQHKIHYLHKFYSEGKCSSFQQSMC
ncbi:MAG: hypothetical protein JOZ78_24335 [Chroococcidiopsidaceae cyanobacterium CP_BM_ER_R8_30]|nr:hypothetical protein [Chroococcidiopsidaceae cyanobacterium CP_BM_ER_R8_30]